MEDGIVLELPKLRRMVENAADLTSDSRELSEKDRDYYDGFQWTAEEESVLRKRKQPVITINRIKRKIDAMVGIEQRGRSDPRAYPRNPGDEDAADLATKALVFVEEQQRIDVKRSSAFETLLVEGYGGVEICVEEKGGQMDVAVKRLRWEEIFYDPHSREKDFSDASYMGVMKWMSLDAAMAFAQRFWEGSREDLIDMLDVSGGNTQSGETYEDRPMHEGGFVWADKRLKRVRVAQMYYQRDGIWHLAIFTGKGELYNQPSPYLDEFGKPDNAMVLMSAYVDRENRRYGVVRDMISAQDEVNKRRSKLLHSLNSRQTVGIKGAVSVANMKKELAAPDGHVEVDPTVLEGAMEAGMKAFEIIPTADQTAGQFNLLVEAKNEIDMLGPNASLIGQMEGQQSGRAIMAQQQAGLAELAPIYDSLRDWTERVYRHCWNRIRQFWTEPRWIRITEEEDAPQFIGINQMQMGPMGPQMVNQIAQIDVDIIVSQAPEYASLRAEQFEMLGKMAQSGIPIPPRVIIEASDLRDKKRLLEMLEGPPEQARQAAQQAQLAATGVEADIDATKAKAERDRAAAAKDIASIPRVQAEAADAQIQNAARTYMARQVGL